MSLDIGFDAQTPSLPQGGGAVNGLGETFTPDLSTGTGSYKIPLDCPNGPNDIGPRLSLRYDTTLGNGAFGMGFSLPIPRLLRSTSRGFPRYDTTDTLMLEGAGELVALQGGVYRPQVDGGVWRVEAAGDGFRLIDREGLYYYLGTSASARLMDGTKVYAWHLERIEDVLGNTVVFTWLRDGNQLYLASIAYGAYEVKFRYESRPDIIRWGRAGFPITTALRSRAIELHLPSSEQPLLRRWTLSYTQDAANGSSLMTEVKLSGFDENSVQLDAPPLRLGYSAFQPRELTRFQNVDDGAAPSPLQQSNRRVELIDWDGNGLPDLLEIAAGGRTRLWSNIGNCTWARPKIVADLPLFASTTAAVGFVDMNGDGVADLVRLDRRIDSYVPRVPGGGFERPVSWQQSPSVLASAPNARLVDLDGDGVLDLLASSADYLSLYYRFDPDGWVDRPQTVPRGQAPNVNLADPHIFLADMTGDGSADLVRVDGAGVTYWQYLGMGRWEQSITMANPPKLPFNVRPDRLFLTDVDGDGCADLIYVGEGTVCYWINQGGNRFSDVREINYVPTGQIAVVRLADMRGSGTAGLLWSTSGPFERGTLYYYLDFSGDAKPYLLNSIDNGVGLTTTVSYTTSAQQFTEAVKAGQPWETFLPIAVSVVDKIVVSDIATGQVSTSVYRYHNGRYDGILREFAGFGRVDVDELGDTTAPTLRITTWFHIGLDLAQMREPQTVEQRRRLRAIRGRIYRQERYGLDGLPQQSAPYDRLEQEWSVLSVNTPGGAVDIPRLVKNIRSTFERTATATSVITTTNTAWDELGNITETVQTSEVPDDPTQKRTLITRSQFAQDVAGRFLARSWRVQQFDGAGTLIADTITQYDGTSEGNVGTQGLVTKRSSLVLSDTLVTDVYGTIPPDFTALGYYRRLGESGWWIDQATYHRTEDATSLHGGVTGPRGVETSFDFDTNKTYPVRITDPCGNTSTAEYDYRICRVKHLTNASGSTSLSLFDALARAIAIIEPGDTAVLPTVAYTYTTASLPVEMSIYRRAVSGNDSTIDIRKFYDSAGKLIEQRVRDDIGEIMLLSQVYSSRGFLAQKYLERRPTSADYIRPQETWAHTTFTYDALGRLTKQQNPDSSHRTLIYSPLLVEEADEEDTRTDVGATHAKTPTRRWFDSTGCLRAIEENLGGRWLKSTYEYDIKGNLMAHTDALGNTVRMWYDFLGRTLRVERPEQGTVVVLDATGNAVESRNLGGMRLLYEFDECNRPTTVRYNTATATPVIRFTYHDAGRPAPAEAGTHTVGGHCVRIDDESGITIFDYDERGRVALKRSRPLGTSQTYDLNFQYRADGQIASIVYPDSGSGRTIIRYGYDQRGNVAVVPGVVSSVDYDLMGRRRRVRYGNGTEQTSTYDDFTHRLTAMQLTGSSGILRTTQYQLDLVGNLTRIDSPDPKQAVTYAYDDLYRLIEADVDSGENWSYRYNDVGNLIYKSDVGDYHYGENGAPAACLTSAGGQTFTYTPLGEMKQTPWGTHTFNPLGRLTQVVGIDGTGQIDFSYNYAGIRVAARSSGEVSTPVDRLTPDTLYAIESGVLVVHLFDGEGIAARQPVGGGTIFLHPDHLGSLAVVTDATGNQIDTMRYDPYGKLLERTGTGAANPIGFTGGTPEPWSGLLYLNTRYYHPSIGQFISPDSIVQDAFRPIAWSSYVYCGDNPTSYVDHNGQSFWGIFLATVAIVALVALMIVFPVSAAVVGAVIVGMVSGGLVGGISTAMKGGSAEDIVTGALVGAAVGGWAAYASAAIPAVLGTKGVLGGIIAGGVRGAINGAAMGFASGVAGGKGSFDDIWQKTLVGALVGLAVGAALGGLSQYKLEQSPNLKPELGAKSPASPSPDPDTTGLQSQHYDPMADPHTLYGPNPPGTEALPGKILDYGLQQAEPYIKAGMPAAIQLAGSQLFQVIAIDLTSGTASVLFDYAIDYINREGIGPVKSPKGKWG